MEYLDTIKHNIQKKKEVMDNELKIITDECLTIEKYIKVCDMDIVKYQERIDGYKKFNGGELYDIDSLKREIDRLDDSLKKYKFDVLSDKL